MDNKTNQKERVFSIELKSKRDLKNITISNDSEDRVTLEGTLGTLVEARFEEGVVLEVAGTKGVLRLDLKEDEIKKTKKSGVIKQ